MNHIQFPELAGLTFAPVLRAIRNWWLRRKENHYLMCAAVENAKAKQAQANVAYYQKRAAIARSERN